MGASVSIPEPDEIPLAQRQACLSTVDLNGIAELLRSGRATRVVCIANAGTAVMLQSPRILV